jgi:tetratricopeptide (TPR) repeat protein
LSLTRKQKIFITKNKNLKSPKRLAKDLSISKEEVEKYLATLSENNKRPRKIFYVILILIPILFFVFLEVGLRIFNYGNDLSTWVKISDTHMGLNPDFAKRYFYTVKKVPQSIQDVFTIKKPKNTYRVFVLGGSSAAGYPFMPLGSFSRYIRRRLELSYPELNIEVVNVSLTAVNTYTIRDLIPDVLEQSPDLILIYTGHNEYYGALGVGSLESLGKSRTIVNFLLELNKYKTTQLLRDFIIWLKKNITSNKKNVTGTLMSRMAREQSIPYESDIYNLGLKQFEGNFNDIITAIKKTKTPVVVSTLACNLKDQPPFISKKTKNYPSAITVFYAAQKELKNGNTSTADSLFRLAKELDQLRFRAPKKINEIIIQLCKKNKIPIVNADSILSSLSPQNIIGNNLMVDHLHLTLNGYKLLGKSFYKVMHDKYYLPKINSSIPFAEQDSITRRNFIFSELDSTISNFKIKLLKNDWPFVKQSQRKKTSTLIKLNNFIDTLAYKFVKGDEEWEKVHRKLAVFYFSKGKFNKGKTEIDLLIHQYPTVVEYYNFIANELIIRKKFDEALTYLEKGYQLEPDHFFTKWIGIIYLSKGRLKTSIEFLEKSLIYKKDDAQVLYNLSGAYAKSKKFTKALENIKKCLVINPNYKGAKLLLQQLKALVK